MILAEIEQRTGRRIAELFDLIAGTSTGGILALGLTVPHEHESNKPRYEASQMVSFYEADGKEIFHSFWRDVVSLHGLIEERYPAQPIEGVLQKYLGEETKLSQALTEIVITSYEIETCRPFLFTRRKARARRGGRFDPRMWEVARSTTAAPTYFAPFQIKRPKSSHLPPLAFIDAGVFLNNPTLCAYTEAVGMHSQPAAALSEPHRERFEAERAPRGGSIRGGRRSPRTSTTWCCRSARASSIRRSGMRMPRTGEPSAGHGHSSTSPMTAPATRSTAQMRQLMHVVKRPYLYYRFQPILKEGMNAMDDTSERNMVDLKRRAESIFNDPEKLEKIEKICRLLTTRFDNAT